MRTTNLNGTNHNDDDDDQPAVKNMTCYTGGETVFNNHQMCDVTSVYTYPNSGAGTYSYPSDRKILDMLPDRPPQVTFSCDAPSKSCDFQFWTAQQESFYCGLDECVSSRETTYDKNTTTYNCEKIQCSCIPGRFICGEAGSVGTCGCAKD